MQGPDTFKVSDVSEINEAEDDEASIIADAALITDPVSDAETAPDIEDAPEESGLSIDESLSGIFGADLFDSTSTGADANDTESDAGSPAPEEIVDTPTVKDDETADYYSSVNDSPDYDAYRNIVPSSPFSDVQDSSEAYYESICWAGNNFISEGYSDGTFRSNRSCTRGEFIMFLWKMKGRPSPAYVSRSPFKDVPKTHAFYKAVLWGHHKRG